MPPAANCPMDKRRVGMEICPSGAEWCTHRAIETVPYGKMERMRRLRATGVGRPYDKARKIA